MPEEYEFLIVGSGAGGATLARELAKRGKKVAVVEKGEDEKKIGTFRDSARYYDTSGLIPRPKKSKEGVTLWRALMGGGSTVVSCGNGTRCLEEELVNLGISLEDQFREAEAEMGVAPMAR